MKPYNGINGLQEGAGEKRLLTPRVIFERRPHPMWTYFIRGPEGIKIGKSRNPEERKKGLQLAHASELEIMVTVPESRISEEDAHQMFKHIRLSGEWFRPDPELLAFIETLKGPELEPLPLPLPEPTEELEPPRPIFRQVKTKTQDPIIGKLHRLRSAHGDETPIGHRCSNLAQMIPTYKTSTDPDQRASLAGGIKRQVDELRKLGARFH